MTPRSFHFPLRNRVLSGLSDAILVVEAGQKSGSLITVRHALEQGRSVFALPGRVDHPEALGCLQLLRDGAAPAIHPADVAAEFFGAEVLETWDRRGTNEREGAALERAGGLGPSLRRLFASQDRWHPNQLAEALGVSFSALLEELNRLEISGSLLRLPGGFYACGPLEERE